MNDAGLAINDFITAKYPQVTLEPDQDIFALGFVNSLFAMQLVMFLEKTFGTRIPNEELSLDNFRSIDAMLALLDRCAPAAA